jgi:uncharacterized protein YeaO (DUF488 family)
MIYTSYFANIKNLPKKLKPISISRFSPEWYTGEEDKSLAPSKDLLLGYRSGKYNKQDYINIYKEQLSNLNPFDVHQKHQDHALLCYEKSSDFCHRHLLSEWLNDNGIQCFEKTLTNFLILIDKDNINKKGISNKLKILEFNNKNDVFVVDSKDYTQENIDWADYIIHFTNESITPSQISPSTITVTYKNISCPFEVSTAQKLSKTICSKNDNSIFVFSDNLKRDGLSGQASIRDCSNSFGVATKNLPSTTIDAYFTDKDSEMLSLVTDLKNLWTHAKRNNIRVLFPESGISAGSSNLKDKSPAIFNKLNTSIDAFFSLSRVK